MYTYDKLGIYNDVICDANLSIIVYVVGLIHSFAMTLTLTVRLTQKMTYYKI